MSFLSTARSTSVVVVYHADCHDGVTAAWVALQKCPGAELYPAFHGAEPDLKRLSGREVYFVDFTWPASVVFERVLPVVNKLTILDHHESAMLDFEAYSEELHRKVITDDDTQGRWNAAESKLRCYFDMTMCGAAVAARHFNVSSLLVDYVNDRDMRQFRLPCSREIHAATTIMPLDVETRAKLSLIISDPKGFESLRKMGEVVLATQAHIIEEVVESAQEAVLALGPPALVVTLAAKSLASEVGNRLASDGVVGVVLQPQRDGTTYVSLRSVGDTDVSAYAKSRGGGGHKHAAAFRLRPGDIL